MVKIKGKFTAKTNEVTDPLVIETCAQPVETWRSRSEKLNLFSLYLKYNKSPDAALAEDMSKYSVMTYKNAGKWVLRVGVYSALGGFYSWIASWMGLSPRLSLILIPLTLLPLSYQDYQLNRIDYYKVMERHEPQMLKWLCAHTPKH